MDKEIMSVSENNLHNNFDFFNTRVISTPTKLNKVANMVRGVITISIIIALTPFAIHSGSKMADKIYEPINKSISRDLHSLK